jgi:Uma2 family endonuclease
LLADGDRLTRDEFIRRWEAMPALKRCELINGVVHVPSPVSIIHSDYQMILGYWLTYYSSFTDGCRVGANGTWLMTGDSAPQPDIALRIEPSFGGQSSQEGPYSAGAPELIVEVANTTANKDHGEKLRLYEQSSVREYITVQPRPRRLIWRELHRRKYREIAPGDSGWYRSRFFPGLWLDPDALWSLNAKAITAAVQIGTSRPNHAAFVRELQNRRK